MANPYLLKQLAGSRSSVGKRDPASPICVQFAA
jgi:hypothetical protein